MHHATRLHQGPVQGAGDHAAREARQNVHLQEPNAGGEPRPQGSVSQDQAAAAGWCNFLFFFNNLKILVI